MRTLYFLLFLCLSSTTIKAQIVCPDTVYADSSVTYYTSTAATTYTWKFDTASSLDVPMGTPTVIKSGSPLATPTYTTMINDNGHWYGFTTNYHDQIIKFDFGTNPNSTPTSTTYGSLGLSGNTLEGVEVVKDSATNMWYLFAVDFDWMIRMSFGTSLSGSPTDTLIQLTTTSGAASHQLSIKKYGNEWIGFIGAASSKLSRLEFGTSITNVPVYTQITTTPTSPTSFALHNEGGIWYMLVSDLHGSGSIFRLNFGTNIKNNSPTSVNLGTYGAVPNNPRGVVIVENCSQLLGYVFNENDTVVKFDFHGSILNTPTTSLHALGGIGAVNAVKPFIYQDTLFYALTSFSPGAVYRLPFLKLNTDTTTFYNSVVKHTFTTTGLHNVTLYCDQGNSAGTDAYCKSVFVRHALNVNNIAANKNVLISYPNPANNEWFVSIPGNNKNAVLYLYTLDGKLMQTANLQAGINKLNFSNLCNGSYFYTITADQDTYSGKVLKQ